MDSPATRLGRMLAGFCLALLLITAMAFFDGRLTTSEMGMGYGFVIVAILAGLVALMFKAVDGRPHGSLPSDAWISRESEDEMRLRLEAEMSTAGIGNIGTNWARMEMEHLEARHGEEE
jgi:hypothetical protein